MTITTPSLTRAAGICAAIAGLLFIAVQINHPPMDVASTTTTDWVVRSIAKAVMAALALAGITGMYLRQVRRTGMLGLAGYLLLGAGYLVILSIEVIAAFVLPVVAHTSPAYVNDLVTAAAGGTPTGDIGGMQTVFAISGVAYMAGGLLFGIALFRAHVLARWAAALLALGTVATAALAVLPASFNRPFAVPTGVALIGLGISLWRDQRNTAPQTAPATSRVEPVAVR
ncbi:MAG: hypothetical protein M3071_00045 [Actinomycetota bacterium]|nr:hypothetical protein [Actinomycetota bacterium]